MTTFKKKDNTLISLNVSKKIFANKKIFKYHYL